MIIGKVWKINSKVFAKMVEESYSWTDMIEKVYGKRRGSSESIKKRIDEEKIDTSHFTHSSVSKTIVNKLSEEDVRAKLVKGKYQQTNDLKGQLYRYNILEEKCSKCGLEPIWNSKRLVLQLDHINGDNCDNNISNLRILCPNCHSQTDTFCSSKFKKPQNKCVDCEKLISKKSTRCCKCQRIYRNSKLKKSKCLDCGTNVSIKSNRCISCSIFNSRKVKERPSLETLRKEKKTMTWVAMGKKYGVSDNCIRKWINI